MKPKQSKNLYRYVGIGFLVMSLYSLYGKVLEGISLYNILKFPEDFPQTYAVFQSAPLYAKIVSYIYELVWPTIMYLWLAIIGIMLIKTNKYSKQILYNTYGWIFYFVYAGLIYGIFDRNFILTTINLISAGIMYYFFIRHDNRVSRFIRGSH